MSDGTGAEWWDGRYREGRQWSVEPNAWVAEILADVPPGDAVDLGAGEGRNALWLAARGWRVTAVDFADAGLAAGRERAAELGVEVAWVRADVAEWSPAGELDLVLLCYLQLERPLLEQVMGTAGGWLRQGGRLVVIGHDLDNLEQGTGGPRRPEVLHTEAGLRRGAQGLVVEQAGQRLREVPGAPRPAIDTILVAHRP